MLHAYNDLFREPGRYVTPVDVYLHGIGTASPDNRVPQSRILEFMTDNLDLDEKHNRFLKKIYSGSAIDYRYSVIPDFGLSPNDFTFFPATNGLAPEPTTAERNRIFVSEANRLAEAATTKVLERLDITPSKITHLVTASCTGFSAPGFDFHLVKSLGFMPSTERFHLGFMGCYAAMPALRLARHICRSDPKAIVLVVNVEICTLHFRNADDLDTLVVNSLFADGASAAVVSADKTLGGEKKGRLSGFATTIVPNSEDEMAWMIGDHGFDMRLSAYVPRLLGTHLLPLFDDLLARYGIEASRVDRYAIHPGGRAIVDKVADALELERSDLSPSYDVLKEYGNMSSATIMFVLKRILDSDSGNIVTAAFGPGLTVESALLEVV